MKFWSEFIWHRIVKTHTQWQGLLKMVMKLWVTKRWEFIEYLNVGILKKDTGVGSNFGTM
jgi:hypothetical protein